MKNVLGTPFETSLRMLILLDINNNEKMTENMLCALDFITIYALDFHICDYNLNGYGDYRFAEYASKKIVAKEALKNLVLDGLVDVKPRKNGFIYFLSNQGKNYIEKFNSNYADDYRMTASEVCEELDFKKEYEIISMINEYTVTSL